MRLNDHYKERSSTISQLNILNCFHSFTASVDRGKSQMEMTIQICKSKQERLVLGLCLVLVLIVQNNHTLTMDNIFVNTTSTFRLNYNQISKMEMTIQILQEETGAVGTRTMLGISFDSAKQS